MRRVGSGLRARVAARLGGAGGAHVLVLAGLTAIAFGQRVGETTFDTKFDLTADPIAALGRALTFWNPEQNLGGVQNQAYGYFFPQGSWFALADLAQIPDWVAQRMWSAALLIAAYAGARRLARALGIGSQLIPVLVGLCYALTPRIVALSGVLSAEALPSAVLPWVCLPLVLGLRGAISPRRAGLLSGAAMLFFGGVNAVENLAALPLPFLLAASALGRPAGRRLALWWATATAAASLWWLLPLLMLGRYSPPFLDFVESAATTTRTSGWSNAARGAEHWLNYLFLGGRPWWEAAHSLSTSPGLALAAAGLAALGAAGLFSRAMPLRGPFALSALVGLACLVAGHGGLAGTPAAPLARDLLDGPLAPLRNVHKVDPLVQLPLALGFGAACAVLATTARRSGRVRARAARIGGIRARWIAAGLVAAALAAGSAPVFADTLRHPGWDQVPLAWTQAAAWLDADGPGTTLVVPAAGFGQQTWGWTVDEPIQGLVAGSWAARSQVPLVPPATIRMLDGLVERFEGGGSPGLANALAAAGITRVLLRNDVDEAGGDVVAPARVAVAIAESPGLDQVASFGESEVPGVPLLQVYRVRGSRGAAELAAADLPLVAGGPEDVITAREEGLLGPGEHARVGVGGDGAAPAIVGDGYRLIERQYGRLHDAVSQVMTPAEPYRLDRKVPDYPGVAGVPRVSADFADLRAVTASSSAGYVDGLARTRPEQGPAAAVDGDPATWWSSAAFEPPDGQWVELELKQDRPIGQVTVRAGVETYLGAPVRRIRVDAGGRWRETGVDPDSGLAVVDFGGAIEADRVRVTVLEAGPVGESSQVALRDIEVAGVDQSRELVIPDTGADAGTSFVFSATGPQRACRRTVLGPECAIEQARSGDEQAGMARRFTVGSAGEWEFSGQVMALSSPAAAHALEPLGDAVAGRSESVFGADPAVSAMFAVDSRAETSWLAQSGDPAPEIELTWDRPRRLDRISVAPSLIPATTPSRAELVTDRGERRSVRVGGSALGFFDPVRASSVRIVFGAAAGADLGERPIGMAELRLHGIGGLSKPVATSLRFSGICGFGPDLYVDGDRYRTRVAGKIGDIVAGRRLRWTTCDGPVRMGAGTHHLVATATDAYTPVRVALKSQLADSGTRASGAVESASRILVGSERSDRMEFSLGAGGASVLVLGQNANQGWRARVGDRDLRPVVVDGWQQGFEVPAGTSARMEVWFEPGPRYRLALGAGAGAALALVAALVFDLVAGRRSPAVPGRAGARADRARSAARARRWAAVALLAGLAMGAVLAGPVFAAFAVVGLFAGRAVGERVVIGLGTAAVFASGLVAVLADGLSSGEPAAGADLCAAAGFGLLAGLLSLLAHPGEERRG